MKYRSTCLLAAGQSGLVPTAHAVTFDDLATGLDQFGEERRSIRKGKLDMYVPAHAWYMPYAFLMEQRHHYNNDPQPGFGLGIGRYDETGNRHGLYALAFTDSNQKWSVMASYGYSWQYGSPDVFHDGVGVTAGLMSRADYLAGSRSLRCCPPSARVMTITELKPPMYPVSRAEAGA